MNSDVKQFLEDAASRPMGEEVNLSIRALIAKWGAQRRGYGYVREIKRDLRQMGLFSEPSFETGWIDTPIRLFPIRKEIDSRSLDLQADGISDDQQTTSMMVGTALKVGSLEAASGGVRRVRRSDSLVLAQSVMIKNDFSQLPVMSTDRDLEGAVSWESIAQKRIHQADCVLGDCIVPADVVGIEDDLLLHIPRIIQAGYVFVRARDRSISGVITTSDLSATFLALAGPFLLIGEVERRLRQIVAAHFTPAEIKAARDERYSGRQVESVDDLSFGEIVRLFQPRDRWNLLGWQIDRSVFCDALESTVTLRNDVMHFSPDPIGEHSLTLLRNLLKWLNLLL